MINYILFCSFRLQIGYITCKDETSDCSEVTELWSVPTSVVNCDTLDSKVDTFVSKVLTEVLRVETSDSSAVIDAPYII